MKDTKSEEYYGSTTPSRPTVQSSRPPVYAPTVTRSLPTQGPHVHHRHRPQPVVLCTPPFFTPVSVRLFESVELSPGSSHSRCLRLLVDPSDLYTLPPHSLRNSVFGPFSDKDLLSLTTHSRRENVKNFTVKLT